MGMAEVIQVSIAGGIFISSPSLARMPSGGENNARQRLVMLG